MILGDKNQLAFEIGDFDHENCEFRNVDVWADGRWLTCDDNTIFTKGKKEGFIYRRYCDDLLIICKPSNANKIRVFLEDFIEKDYKLTIQAKKTEVIDFRKYKSDQIRAFDRDYDEVNNNYIPLTPIEKNFKNLQYLGFEFNGEDIYIRPGSLSRFFRRMKARVVKSVSMTYSKNSKSDLVFKQQIYNRYSHLGKRNFISYAKNAASELYTNKKGDVKEGLNSPSIRNQIANHMRIINQEIEKTSSQKAQQKARRIAKRKLTSKL